jgi:peptidoglycan/xylan/chitin deacetylase (PgdA/CDA1 family)
MARRLAALTALLAFGGGIAGAVILAERGSSGSRERTAVSSARRQRAHVDRRVRGRHDKPVPILMYHVLARAPAAAAYPQLYVPPNELAAQTSWLSAHGYHAVALHRVFAYWRRAAPLPRKPIVLSFDDGYLSDYSVALPTLRRHRWAGVLNLVVDNVVRGVIRPWQVRRLIAAGWEIGDHTTSHLDLTTLDSAQLRDEVAGSRAQLRRLLGKPIDFFCYPLGRYDRRVIAAVKAAGFRGALSEDAGLARRIEPFTLARIRIEPGDGVQGLAGKLRQASD